jgi:hypothetical protein
MALVPPKYDPVLIVDADAVTVGPSSFQPLQSVAGRFLRTYPPAEAYSPGFSGSNQTFHTFIRETLVTVVVEVLDIRNATARAEQDVSIRADYPDPPDFCDGWRPCVVGDECVEGVCSFNGAGIE